MGGFMSSKGWIVGALFLTLAMVGAIPAGAAVPHTVVPGETLWSIAAANNFTTRSIAAYDGLSPDAQVVIGHTILIPSVAEATGARPTVPQTAGPARVMRLQPTNQRTTASEIRSVAADHGVPPSVAAGLAWQESGFNNAFTSSAGARGVMQITPATWDFVRSNLGGSDLNPSSAQSNVHAGVLYLNYLQRQTGSLRTAVGAYYQGLASVREHGLLPGTQHYVDNVMAEARRFGG
jgi:soluble lytic murein transglycosylase-like protein